MAASQLLVAPQTFTGSRQKPAIGVIIGWHQRTLPSRLTGDKHQGHVLLTSTLQAEVWFLHAMKGINT